MTIFFPFSCSFQILPIFLATQLHAVSQSLSVPLCLSRQQNKNIIKYLTCLKTCHWAYACTWFLCLLREDLAERNRQFKNCLNSTIKTMPCSDKTPGKAILKWFGAECSHSWNLSFMMWISYSLEEVITRYGFYSFLPRVFWKTYKSSHDYSEWCYNESILYNEAKRDFVSVLVWHLGAFFGISASVMWTNI